MQVTRLRSCGQTPGVVEGLLPEWCASATSNAPRRMAESFISTSFAAQGTCRIFMPSLAIWCGEPRPLRPLRPEAFTQRHKRGNKFRRYLRVLGRNNLPLPPSLQNMVMPADHGLTSTYTSLWASWSRGLFLPW